VSSSVESKESQSKSAKSSEESSSSNTPSQPVPSGAPPLPPPLPSSEPSRHPAEDEEEKAQRRKRLAKEIKRIDSATSNLIDNGLFDTRHKKLFGKDVDKERDWRSEMDELFRNIHYNLYWARKSLDNEDLAATEFYVTLALRAHDKALYAPSWKWRFTNVYAGVMWIYLVGFLVAVLVFYLIQLDTNILGIHPPGVRIQESALHATTWGTVGAILRGLWFLKDKVTDRRYRNAFRIYVLSTPFLGGLFGAIFYFLIISGLFIVAPDEVQEILTNGPASEPNATTSTTQTGATNQAGGIPAEDVSSLAIIPIAALAGFNWEWAVMILKRIGDSFKPETEPEDKIDK
jgi:hypothetical protein